MPSPFVTVDGLLRFPRVVPSFGRSLLFIVLFDYYHHHGVLFRSAVYAVDKREDYSQLVSSYES